LSQQRDPIQERERQRLAYVSVGARRKSEGKEKITDAMVVVSTAGGAGALGFRSWKRRGQGVLHNLAARTAASLA